ncbi:MAG: hypothetical protein ACLFUS_03120 [Candidatus Sumerlaeia bacterium]
MKMKNVLKAALALFAAMLISVGTIACDSAEEAAEETGDEIEEATD